MKKIEFRNGLDNTTKGQLEVMDIKLKHLYDNVYEIDDSGYVTLRYAASMAFRDRDIITLD